MEAANSSLLPHILETLNRKPEMCDTYENLRNEIKEVFSKDDLSDKVYKALDKALNVGRNLGIITITDDLIRIPYNYQKSRPNLLQNVQKNSLRDTAASEDSEYFGTQPRRTYTVKPNFIAHGRYRKSSRNRRRRGRISRRRSRSRRR